MFNIRDKISEMVQGWVEDTLEAVFNFFAKILFNPEGLSGFFATLYKVFVGIGGAVLVCIILFRIVVFMLSEAEGSREANVGELIIATLKASAMVLVLPFMTFFSSKYIVQPLGEWMFGLMGKMTADKLLDYISSDSVLSLMGNKFAIELLTVFLLVVFIAFVFKICIYQADIILLQIMSVWAAISIASEDSNYMSVWWRELLSQVVSVILQMVLMVGIVEILTSDFKWYSLVLLIGFGVLIIRGPSVTRSMWYATGSGRATMNAGKTMTRLAMMKLK
ncbi:conjugal transfer protein TrbL family protein [Listeria booriae]|uniref:conjugal transfer protein TrbL family protein n=1 Tax=Listeria booriae TaxID=1552123 RepID=UPI00162645AD|nr:conjugal transfer protein TrbL family protein [Listeria booriae]MBC1228624.1 hypothetical protein [Listeria booriae]